MERIVLKHLSGSKAGRVDEISLKDLRALTIGRDPSLTVCFDPDRDDLVSTRHATIERDPQDPFQFVITDHNSRNGTFINNRRINGTVRIAPGDAIQLGKGGPELQFDIAPRPVPATRVSATERARPMTPSTRVGSHSQCAYNPASEGGQLVKPHHDAGALITANENGNALAVPAAAAPPSAIGKTTVVRMISEAKSETRRNTVAIAAALFLIISVVGGVLGYRSYQAGKQQEQLVNLLADQKKELSDQIGNVEQWKQQMLTEQKKLEESVQKTTAKIEAISPLAPEAIAAASRSVVYIQLGWRLTDTAGTQLYHRIFINLTKDNRGRVRPIFPDRPQLIPMYLQLPNGRIEPVLTTNSASPNIPIRQTGSGSGFVVGEDGFIITNNHVAAGWRSRYRPIYAPSLVVSSEGKLLGFTSQGPPDGAYDWVPAETRQTRVIGENFQLNVQFQRSSQPYTAKLVQSSDQHDVALIKIEAANKLEKLEMNDNYETVKVGEPITVLGYPGVSPNAVAVVASENPFDSADKARLVPEPTVTPGAIGKIIRGGESADGAKIVDTGIGDSYQLTVNATGAGNSGGPVLDNKGRVVAIFFAGTSRPGDAAITFAIPIRYAQSLMGPK